MSELLSRRIPGHIWVRLGITISRTFEAGHGWSYHGIVHRDAWRIGPLGIYLLRMPNNPQEVER